MEKRTPTYYKLTLRELEVLTLVAAGQHNKEIGRELFITDRTVQTHIGRILHKLGLCNRQEMITYAFAHQWIDPVPIYRQLEERACLARKNNARLFASA